MGITHNDTTGNDADGDGDIRIINELEKARPDENRMVTTWTSLAKTLDSSLHIHVL
jgi:hypothetical protein